jgi:environmental stress-induced protein Ves
MYVVRYSDLVESPWKNGGGVTREVAAARDDGKLLWRLSLADVACDGQFSDFTGLMRILTIIEGGPMDLVTSDGTLQAIKAVPVRFDGATKVVSKLPNGPLRDFNLMFDPIRVTGEVMALQGPEEHILEADTNRELAVHCLSNDVEIDGAPQLQHGDTVLIEAGRLSLKLADGTSALLITLDLRPQIDAKRSEMASR